LSLRRFEQLSGINDNRVFRLFPKGGWLEVLRLAGLERHPNDKDALTDEDLLEEYHRVVCKVQQIPTWYQFAANAAISAEVVQRRFGGRQGTLKRYREWLEQNHPESPLLALLQIKSKHEIVTLQAPARTGIPAQWQRDGGVEFGAPISFRGLRHAPINEQGVVYLFGMVSLELGYIVEAIQSAYPDCEAKRCIDTKQNRWQRVRIEFEYRSRNFRDHGHDPSGCDLIVCWEHDWPECPLEVIELRSVIDQLEG
jgi:hypothetical protein